jgi:hypothetical protein
MHDTLERLSKKDLKELLVKGWMTHDGMWFFHSLQESGIETTNRVNLAAIKSMAAAEIKRIRKAIGIEKKKITTMEEVEMIMDAMFDIVKGEFMDFEYSFEGNVCRWEWKKCWAHDGIKMMGALDTYKCGVIWRVQCWYEALGVRLEIRPLVNGCLMHQTGKCAGEMVVHFDQ